MKKKHIVVGVDFSESSKAALREAARIASMQKARLHVIHVVDLEFFEREVDEKFLTKDLLVDKAYEALSKFSLREMEFYPSLDLHVFTGHPFYELMYQSERIKADMLVLGAYGNSGAGNRVGTFANRFVRKAPIPVLLIREGQEAPYQNVVVAYDFSDTSKQALLEGIEIASEHKACLSMLHVHVPYRKMISGVYGDVPMLTEDYYDEYIVQQKHEMESDLLKLKKGYSNLKVKIEVVRSYSASTGICDYLNDVGAGLVVIGTQGKTNLKTLILGTTAERVLYKSESSILAVKPKDFKTMV